MIIKCHQWSWKTYIGIDKLYSDIYLSVICHDQRYTPVTDCEDYVIWRIWESLLPAVCNTGQLHGSWLRTPVARKELQMNHNLVEMHAYEQCIDLHEFTDKLQSFDIAKVRASMYAIMAHVACMCCVCQLYDGWLGVIYYQLSSMKLGTSTNLAQSCSGYHRSFCL